MGEVAQADIMAIDAIGELVVQLPDLYDHGIKTASGRGSPEGRIFLNPVGGGRLSVIKKTRIR
jgi:hypothetical protein